MQGLYERQYNKHPKRDNSTSSNSAQTLTEKQHHHPFVSLLSCPVGEEITRLTSFQMKDNDRTMENFNERNLSFLEQKYPSTLPLTPSSSNHHIKYHILSQSLNNGEQNPTYAYPQDSPVDLSTINKQTINQQSYPALLQQQRHSDYAHDTYKATSLTDTANENKIEYLKSSSLFIKHNDAQELKKFPQIQLNSNTSPQTVNKSSNRVKFINTTKSTSIPTAHVTPIKLQHINSLSKQKCSNEELIPLQTSCPDPSPSHLSHTTSAGNFIRSCINKPLWSSVQASSSSTDSYLTTINEQNEIRQLARDFRHQRNRLRLTQQQVGYQLNKLGYGKFSQSTVSRFENLSLSETNIWLFRPAINVWLGKQKTDPEFYGTIGPPKSSVAKAHYPRKRPRLTPTQYETLRAHFQVHSHPLKDEIQDMAVTLGLTESTVRVWFCNTRQKQKRFQKLEQGMRVRTSQDMIEETDSTRNI